jgi:hypothetical protein
MIFEVVMKLVPFNLEEALANPERVVCKEGFRLVKWQHNLRLVVDMV